VTVRRPLTVACGTHGWDFMLAATCLCLLCLFIDRVKGIPTSAFVNLHTLRKFIVCVFVASSYPPPRPSPPTPCLYHPAARAQTP
jgi:hypothetical protein